MLEQSEVVKDLVVAAVSVFRGTQPDRDGVEKCSIRQIREETARETVEQALMPPNASIIARKVTHWRADVPRFRTCAAPAEQLVGAFEVDAVGDRNHEGSE